MSAHCLGETESEGPDATTGRGVCARSGLRPCNRYRSSDELFIVMAGKSVNTPIHVYLFMCVSTCDSCLISKPYRL